jgi:RNA recognition motif-containing protein
MIEQENRRMKLYVGNLPWSMTNGDLEKLFSECGPVTSAEVINDRDSGRSRGFGFVEMDRADARKAMSKLNGHQIESRALKVSEANDKQRSARRYG